MEGIETISAILGSAVGLAGILLVFIGFVYSRVETLERAASIRKYRIVAKAGILPFLIALVCAWLCLQWLGQPTPLLYKYATMSFQASLIITAIYGVALLFYL